MTGQFFGYIKNGSLIRIHQNKNGMLNNVDQQSFLDINTFRRLIFIYTVRV